MQWYANVFLLIYLYIYLLYLLSAGVKELLLSVILSLSMDGFSCYVCEDNCDIQETFNCNATRTKIIRPCNVIFLPPLFKCCWVDRLDSTAQCPQTVLGKCLPCKHTLSTLHFQSVLQHKEANYSGYHVAKMSINKCRKDCSSNSAHAVL